MSDKNPAEDEPSFLPPDGERKGTENEDDQRRNRLHWAVASQFAYTLVIASCVLGYAGHWLGNQLGGSPWNFILMLLFGGIGFAAEVYRMIIMFSPKDKTGKKDEKQDKGKK